VYRPHGSVARGHTWPADRTIRAYSRGGGARSGRRDREPPGDSRGATLIAVGAALAATAVLAAVLASRPRSPVGKRLARLAPRAQLPNRVRSGRRFARSRGGRRRTVLCPRSAALSSACT